MSSTKGMTTLCAHILEDRGELDLDAPVARYWPEFGQAGKSATTVRQLLSHQSGAIAVPGADELLGWDGRGWQDTEAIAAAIASGEPAWEPGTRHGYHGVTFGWLVGELVRRITGQSLGTFFEAEVAAPLGVACSIGTPASETASVATVMEFPLRPGARSALRAIDPDSKSGRAVLAGAHGSLFADEHGEPRFADFMNQPDVRAAEIGALGATATARALARIYMALADGEDLVSRASIERFRHRTGLRARRRHGRPHPMGCRLLAGAAGARPRRTPPMHGPNDGAFGHMGAGGQIGFADPSARVGVGFVRNHLENQALPLMGAVLVDDAVLVPGGGDKGGAGVRS